VTKTRHEGATHYALIYEKRKKQKSRCRVDVPAWRVYTLGSLDAIGTPVKKTKGLVSALSNISTDHLRFIPVLQSKHLEICNNEPKVTYDSY
jgi:hypothetical protein